MAQVTLDVDVDLDEFDNEELIAELRNRGLESDSDAKGVLTRIVYEHDVLGFPLEQVFDDLIREYRVARKTARIAA